MFFDPGGKGFQEIPLQMPGPTFSHLAAAGIPGTEKKEAEFFTYIHKA
jgi:hypothetical protein